MLRHLCFAYSNAKVTYFFFVWFYFIYLFFSFKNCLYVCVAANRPVPRRNDVCACVCGEKEVENNNRGKTGVRKKIKESNTNFSIIISKSERHHLGLTILLPSLTLKIKRYKRPLDALRGWSVVAVTLQHLLPIPPSVYISLY
uniref:Uncharacterized protein n=1 Tax=Trypanosoma congolense (strain IL3000) TaxID=1068625 RepID=G0UQK4_TRYCI|nr:hypothetical protein, unlikely [Trypanosoma congolense IL3000]